MHFSSYDSKNFISKQHIYLMTIHLRGYFSPSLSVEPRVWWAQNTSSFQFYLLIASSFMVLLLHP